MTIPTAAKAKEFLAKMVEDDDLSDSTVAGYRSLLNRLATFSPTLPLARGDFEAYLDDTGDTPLNTQLRRYDIANRFLKSDAVQLLGIPNVCDEVRRPRKDAPASEVDPDNAGAVPSQGVVDRHLEILRRDGKAVPTLKRYAVDLGRLVEVSPTLPITEDQVYAVLGDPDDYKTNTRRQRFFAMSGLFNSRVYLDLNLGNPLDGIEAPKEGDPRERTFSVQEICDLLVSAETLQEVTFILLILDTGIRVGEAASITIDKIQDGELSVFGKNGRRKVPASPRMEELLKQTANERGEIWYDDRGRLTGEQLGARFRQHVIRTGITGGDLGPHTLRRTFATGWARSNGGWAQLQEMLGHSDIKTTRRYVRIVPLDVRNAQSEFAPSVTLNLFDELSAICTRCPDEITEVISRLPDGGGTPREPQLPPLAAMAAEQRIADELRNKALLEYLKHMPCNERANGRPLKTLPKEIARLVLADVDAGFTLSAIVRRYQDVIPFSRCWLAAVIRNGRLREMAGM